MRCLLFLLFFLFRFRFCAHSNSLTHCGRVFDLDVVVIVIVAVLFTFFENFGMHVCARFVCKKTTINREAEKIDRRKMKNHYPVLGIFDKRSLSLSISPVLSLSRQTYTHENTQMIDRKVAMILQNGHSKREGKESRWVNILRSKNN